MARGKSCFAHTHDYLVPIERHHVRPLSRGGPNIPGNLRDGCANAHGDAHYFLDLIEKRARAIVAANNWGGGSQPLAKMAAQVPIAQAGSYGPKVRRTALDGWFGHEHPVHGYQPGYGEEFCAGVWDRHAWVWDSSGRPRAVLMNQFPDFTTAQARGEVNALLSMATIALAARREGRTL